MKEIASFHIYSEVLAAYHSERQVRLPQEQYNRISQLAGVEEPRNDFLAKVEVGSDAFEEIVDILKSRGALLRDCMRPVEGPSVTVGRSMRFTDEDVAKAKYLRLQLKKYIIDIDADAWRKGRYVCTKKGRPSFKFGFHNMTGSEYVASEAFAAKMRKAGFSGMEEHDVVWEDGKATGFCALKSSVTVGVSTLGGYMTDDFKWVATLNEIGSRCDPGNKFSPELLVYPDGTLDEINASYVRTQEEFGSGDKIPRILIDQSLHEFLGKQKITMEVFPVIEESQYRSVVTGRLDELLAAGF